MDKAEKLLLRLWGEEQGQDVVEYALLLVLISLIAVVAIKTIGSAVSNSYSNAATNMTTAT